MPIVTSNPFDVAVLDAISAQDLRNLGYLLVDDYAGVDPTGALGSDSMPGINQALREAHYNSDHGPNCVSKPVWFTPGAIYRVSDTIKVGTWHHIDGVHMIGGANGARPKIVLDDDANNFGSAGSPRPVVCIRCLPNTSSWPSDPMEHTGNNQGQSNILFNSSFIGIDIDCGDNPGAFGVYAPAAQLNHWADITIDASKALGGWSGLSGRQSAISNLKIIGGVWQIKNDNRQYEGCGGSTVAGLTLVGDGRTTQPITNADFVPLTIVGFDITQTNSGEVALSGDQSGTGYGAIAMIDGIVRSGGDTPFDNSSGKSMYLRNIYVTGTNNLVQSGSRPVVTGSGTWKRINEYAYSDQTTLNGGQSQYPTSSMIDGDVKTAIQLPEPLDPADISSSVSAPTHDPVARHTITIPRVDTGPFENIEVHGAISNNSVERPESGNIFSNGDDSEVASSSSAIEAAIAAAEAAGHNRVFVPKGNFYIDERIEMRPDTVFFGMGTYVSFIATRANWQPTGITFMLRSANDANGTAHLSGITLMNKRNHGSGDGGLGGAKGFDWFSRIHWRTGRHSSLIGPLGKEEWFDGMGDDVDPDKLSLGISNTKRQFYVTNNGGGKFYSIMGLYNGAYGHVDSRVMLIEGTSEPLHIYGLNGEAGKRTEAPGHHMTEIIGASNIRIYGSKREGGGSTTYINDSNNIGIYGQGRQNSGLQGVHVIVGSSDDIVIGLSLKDKPNSGIGSDGNPYENLDGESQVQIDWVTGCSIYRRGTPDDSQVEI